MGKAAVDLIEKLRRLRYGNSEALSDAATVALSEISKALPAGVSQIMNRDGGDGHG